MKLWWFFLILLPQPLFSQISGIVLDAESNDPVPGAAIHIRDTSVLSGQHGNFIFNGMAGKTRITVTHPGYAFYSDSVLLFGKMIIRLTPDSHQLSEIVVSAEMQNQKLKLVPGNDVLLTRHNLENSSGTTITGYFNQAPGVYIQQGALNTNRLIIRGIGSRSPYGTNRIKAYFDEIPITAGEGSTTVEDIDLAGISRIEILKGPSSALYGSGLGGVVRFYPLTENNGDNIRYNSEAGSFGTFRNSLSASVANGKYALTAIASNTYSDGFRQNSRYRRNSAFLYGTLYGRASSLKATFSFVDLNSRIASSIDGKTFDESPHSAAGNWLAIKGYEAYSKVMAGLTYSTEFSGHLMNQATLFSNYIDDYESRPFNILSDYSVNYGLRDRFTIGLGDQTLNLGFEWFDEDYYWKILETLSGTEGALLNHNKENRSYINIFALWTWNIKDKLRLEAGLNFNSLKYKLTDLFADSVNTSGQYRYDPVFSPRLGVNYQLTSFVNIYSSAGHGFSAPSLEETLLPGGQPNPNLKPEQGYNIDAGARLNLLGNKLYVDITQYWLFLNDLLLTKRLTEDIFTGENAGKTFHYGTEALLKYSPLQGMTENKTSLDFTLAVTFSSNRFRSFADTAGDYSGNKLPGIPSGTVSFNTFVKIPSGFQAYVNFKWFGPQYLNDTNTKRYGGYQLVDLKAEYLWKLSGKYKGSLYAGVENVLNKNYASMILVNALPLGNTPPRYYYPGNPRSFYAGVKVEFGKK